MFSKKYSFKKSLFALIIVIGLYGGGESIVKGNNPNNKESKGEKLFFQEELSIEEGLYDPKSIAVDGKGNIYILDRGDQKIKKYSPNGNLLKSVGGKGEGPGETIHAIEISIDENQIFVLDFKSKKINIFDLDLKFLKSFKTGLYFPLSFVASNKKLYLSGIKTLMPTKGSREILHVFDFEGKNLGSFAPQHEYPESSKYFLIPPNFAFPSVLFVDDNILYVGYSYFYEIRRYKINKGTELLDVIKRKDFFHNWISSETGSKVLMAGGLSLKIFRLSDGRILHVYDVISEKGTETCIDIFKGTELLIDRISYYPKDIFLCFFDKKENKIYFIKDEPTPKVVRAYLKFIRK